MVKKFTAPDVPGIAETLQHCVDRLLEDGAEPAFVCYGLTATAAHLGFYVEQDAKHVFAILLQGLLDATVQHLERDEESGEADQQSPTETTGMTIH